MTLHDDTFNIETHWFWSQLIELQQVFKVYIKIILLLSKSKCFANWLFLVSHDYKLLFDIFFPLFPTVFVLLANALSVKSLLGLGKFTSQNKSCLPLSMSTWSLAPANVQNDLTRMMQVFDDMSFGLLPSKFLSQSSQLAPLVDIKETKDKFVSSIISYHISHKQFLNI